MIFSPEVYQALPALGSSDVSAFINGGPKSLGRRVYLKMKTLATRAGMRPTAAWALRDELAERSKRQSSRAMRAGLMLEAYLFGNGEETDWAERGASATEINSARDEAAFVVRHSPSFPTTSELVERHIYGEIETQVTEIAEIRGVWVKCRCDFIWQADDVKVEADMKRWTDPRRQWHNDEDVLDLAHSWGALTQRALYRLILEATRGEEWAAASSAILAIDPTRAEPLDLLVEVPNHIMQAATSQVEDALDQIAAMTTKAAA